MPPTLIKYHCPQCNGEVRSPSHLGRSWCPRCTLYLVPVGYAPEEVEPEEQPEGADHVYDYTTWRPPKHRMAADELPDHKFGYKKRKDRLVKGQKGVSYQGLCTCKKWRGVGFTTRRAAHAQWEGHMAEVIKQGSFFNSRTI